MSEEEKQALTGLCKIEIKRWKAASESNPNMRYMSKLMEIALAALTATPVAWHVYQWRESPKGWDWYLTRAFASEPNNSDGWRSVALFTRPAPAADRVPEGWKLVPVEPTKQMLEASYREASVYSPTAYRAMLAAAPTPNE